MILLGNKCDLLESKGKIAEEDLVTTSELESFGKEQGFAGTMYTSALSGKNVNEGFVALFKEVLKTKSSVSAHARGLRLEAKKDGKKRGCC